MKTVIGMPRRTPRPAVKGSNVNHNASLFLEECDRELRIAERIATSMFEEGRDADSAAVAAVEAMKDTVKDMLHEQIQELKADLMVEFEAALQTAVARALAGVSR